MADNVTANSGTGGAVFATDDISGTHYPITKLGYGALDSVTIVSASNGLPAAQQGTWNIGTVTTVTTVSAVTNLAQLGGTAIAMNTGVRSAGTQRVTIATDDSLAVTNAGTFVVQEDGAALTALQLIDDIVYVDDTATHATGTSKGALVMAAATPTDGPVDANDIGALSMSLDRRLLVDSQLVGQDADITIADGGNAITVDWNGTAPPIGAGLEATALRVTVATDSTGVVSVDDNGGALTVDWNGTTPPIGAGTEAAALRVTLATDSTGLVSVDDNSGSLTVDAANDGSLVAQLGDGTSVATVRNLAANDALNVSIVDAAGNQIVTFGGGTEYVVNAVVPTDPTGSTVVMERDDQLSTVTEVAGDWTNARATSQGELWVALADSSGDPIRSFGGGTQYTEDDIVPANPTGTAGLMERDDALGGITPVAGDWTHQFCDANGALWTAVNNTVTVDGSGVTQPISHSSLAVVGTGTEAAAMRVTIATDSTGVLSIDDNGTTISVDDASGSLTIDNAVLTNLDATIAGSELQVDVVAGAGTFYTQDVAHADPATAPTWLMARDDALTTQETTDGDWTLPRANARGAQWVELDLTNDVTISDGGNVISIDAAALPLPTGAATSALQLPDGHNVTVDNASIAITAASLPLPAGAATSAAQLADGHNVAITGAALTSLQKIDNIAHSGSDVVLVEHVPISGQFDDVATTTVTENQLAPVRITSTRALHVTQQGTVTVDGSGVTQPVSAASLPLPSGAATSAGQLADGHNVTIDNASGASAVNIQDGGNVLSVDWNGTVPPIGAGTETAALRVTLANNSTGLVSVDDGGGTLTVDSGATFSVQEDGDALTALQLIDDTVVSQGTALGTTKNSMVAGSVTTAAPTYTTGQISPFSLNTAGALRVTGGGGGTEYVVNAVVPTDPTGTTAVMERDDQLSTVTEAAGDWTNARATSQGELWVALADSSGDPIRSFGGGTQYTVGTDTYTEATSVGTIASVVRKDAGGTLVNTDNEISALQVDASGNLRVTGGGGGTEYTEDVAAATDPLGTALILVREDARAGSLTSTDGDNVALRGNNLGEAYVIDTDANALLTTIDADTGVIAGDTTSIDGKITACNTGAVVISSGTITAVTDITNTVTVDNGGTFQVQVSGDALTALQKIDNLAHSGSDVALVEHVPISGQFDDVATTTVTENQIAPVRITSGRALHVAQQGALDVSAATVTVDLNSITPDLMLGTDFSDVLGTASLVLATQADAVANTADGLQTTNFNMVYNGTTWDRVREGGTAGSLLIDGSAVTQPISAASLPLPTSASTAALQLPDGHNVTIDNASGASAVNIQDGGNVITVDGTLAGVTTVTTVSTVTNLAQLGGTAVSMDTGARDAGTQRVTIATNDAVPVTNADMTTIAGAVTGSEMQVDLVAALPVGANVVGDVGISGARTSGGTTLYKNIDVDESEDEIKGTAGQVYWIHVMNLSAAVKYLKFYNATAASVIVGTTVPDMTFPVPTQGDTNGAGFLIAIPNGVVFSTAITIAATTGVADNDAGAPGANEVVVNLGYA